MNWYKIYNRIVWTETFVIITGVVLFISGNFVKEGLLDDILACVALVWVFFALGSIFITPCFILIRTYKVRTDWYAAVIALCSYLLRVPGITQHRVKVSPICRCCDEYLWSETLLEVCDIGTLFCFFLLFFYLIIWIQTHENTSN